MALELRIHQREETGADDRRRRREFDAEPRVHHARDQQEAEGERQHLARPAPLIAPVPEGEGQQDECRDRLAEHGQEVLQPAEAGRPERLHLANGVEEVGLQALIDAERPEQQIGENSPSSTTTPTAPSTAPRDQARAEAAGHTPRDQEYRRPDQWHHEIRQRDLVIFRRQPMGGRLLDRDGDQDHRGHREREGGAEPRPVAQHAAVPGLIERRVEPKQADRGDDRRDRHHQFRADPDAEPGEKAGDRGPAALFRRRLPGNRRAQGGTEHQCRQQQQQRVVIGAAEHAIAESSCVGQQNEGGEAITGTGPERARGPSDGEAGEDVADRREGGTDPIDRAADIGAEEMREEGGQQDQQIDRPGPMQRQALGRTDPQGSSCRTSRRRDRDRGRASRACSCRNRPARRRGSPRRCSGRRTHARQHPATRRCRSGTSRAWRRFSHLGPGRALRSSSLRHDPHGFPGRRSKITRLALQKLITMPARDPKATPSSGYR